MRYIIKHREIQPDPWVLVTEEASLSEDKPDARCILPLTIWLPQVAQSAAEHQTGVWLAPDDDPCLLAPYLSQLCVIAIHFPLFTDGRGYSQANWLRRAGYQGELRAWGDVWKDVLYGLQHVGFDAFSIKEGKSLEEALHGLNDFERGYQITYLNKKGLFYR